MSGYPNTLKYFMWPFQVHFRSSLQTKAELIFKEIGRELGPDVFMIGLLRDSTRPLAPLCFEPEKFDYYGHDLVSELDEVAKAQFLGSSESQMLYSGPGQQELMQHRHLANHRRMTLAQRLDEREPESIHYVGDSQFAHGYEIYIVVRFIRKVHDTHVHLFRNTLDDEYGPLVTCSLLHATLAIFLKDAGNLLYKPEIWNFSNDLRSHRQFLQAGAEEFTASIASRGREFMGIHGFYQTCETLSLSTYENEIVTGSLVIAPKQHEAVEILLSLSEAFKFSDYRKTIKLLRLTEDDICVITDSEFVIGLGRINVAKYQADSETLMKVNFTGFHQWEVIHNESRILRMVHGHPQPVDAVITSEKLYSDALRIFSSTQKEDCETLLKLINTAIAAKQGTQLIISENADSESERLKARCFKVIPKKLTADELLRFMRIDGGIMIDQHLNLYAYGVLLDGTVLKKGDNSRGSRYNSALTYYESQQGTNPVMIVVISDDGMVSLIPNLKPQIDHRQVVQAIEIMRSQEDAENYVHSVYIQAQEFLNMHRFYLREEECKQINDSIKKISDHRLRSSSMMISYGDYSVHEDMNNSYYLPGTY